MNFSAVTHVYARFPLMLRLFLLVSVLVGTAGVAIHYIEPETFPTLFEGVWWAIVTASTVGYGDYAPVTTVGRFLAFFVILFGIGFVSFFVTTFASSTVKTRNSLYHGELAFKKEDHFVIVGWNERAKNMIYHIQQLHEQINIVLVDQTLKQSPDPSIHFIHGNPTEDATLKRANIQKAKTVVITANLHSYETEADAKSIITLLAIKGLNPSIYSVVEILTPEQKNNCLRAGADEIIETSVFSSLAMINSTLYHGITKVIHHLLDHRNDHMLLYEKIPSSLHERTFEDCLKLKRDANKLIIGIFREPEVYLNPSPDFILSSKDMLIIIKR